MKRMKKFVSVLLAVIMVLGMSVTVFAADENLYTITVEQNDKDNTVHQYAAYQIFEGDLATNDDGKKVLSNIEWGSGVNGDALLAALKADNTFLVEVEKDVTDEDGNTTTIKEMVNLFSTCTTAAQVAEVLAGPEFGKSDIRNSTLTDAFARVAENHLTSAYESVSGAGNVVIEVIGAGYYLVKDTNGSVETNGAYTRFMLEVVGDATATVKSEVPSGDKKVYITDTNKGESNTAFIGAHVSYEITSKVPNYVGYNYYYFIMNDTLSEGLTFDGVDTVTVTVKKADGTVDTLKQGSIEVTPAEAEGEEATVNIVNGDYYIYTGAEAGNYSFRLAFADIMNYEIGADIVVTYSATINDKAKVGIEGNENAWNLQYSNNPDDTFKGERPDGEKTPGRPSNETTEPFGKTPDEKTLTYVTELDITKYANGTDLTQTANHLLAGAEFTLTGISNQVVLSGVEYYEAFSNTTATSTKPYWLLKEGTYTDVAPTTEVSYVEIGTGNANTEEGYLRDGNGNYYIPEDKTEYDGKTIYTRVEVNAGNYLDVDTKYELKEANATTLVPTKVSIKLTTGEDGKISFKGLGVGTYTLTETVTPAGFNTLDPITITIECTTPESVSLGNEPCTWTMTAENGIVITQNKNTDNVDLGIFAADVINKSGSLLPSTGGIGTTIFYVVGGILVIGAGILLVAKKRMNANK